MISKLLIEMNACVVCSNLIRHQFHGLSNGPLETCRIEELDWSAVPRSASYWSGRNIICPILTTRRIVAPDVCYCREVKSRVWIDFAEIAHFTYVL